MTFFTKFEEKKDIDNKNLYLLSIVENLNHMLNTKKDYGSFLKGYGIRDMNQHSSYDQLSAAIMEEVKYNIEHYESRLLLEEITLLDDSNPFRISFKIRCRIKETEKSLVMEFDSVYKDFTVRSTC